MKSESFLNFAWDCYIRSFENRDSLLKFTDLFDTDQKKEILISSYGDLEYWRKIYLNFSEYIIRNVRLHVSGKIYPVTLVEFHPKFGWDVSSRNFHAYLGKSSLLDSVNILIGHRSYLSGNNTIRGIGDLVIGSYCSIAAGFYVNVSNENHPVNYPASIGLGFESRMIKDSFLPDCKFSYQKPSGNNFIDIGNDVWIGRDVNILSGVKIGHGCVIGAKSFVNRDCEPFGIYAGTPARLLKSRFSEKIIEELLEINWWDWSEEKISANKNFFETNLKSYSGSLKELII